MTPTALHQYANAKSLPESHGTVRVSSTGNIFRKLFSFMGPGYLVAVGYMDPGNWATALSGGAQFGYTLLSICLIVVPAKRPDATGTGDYRQLSRPLRRACCG